MFTNPSEYGQGLAGWQQTPSIPGKISLVSGGLDYSRPSAELQEGQTPYCIDVRLDRGGVGVDWGWTNLGSASASATDKNIMKLAPFELAAGTKFIMRLRPKAWDRWDGSTWLELSGALNGTTSVRPGTCNYGDNFIGANGVDTLRLWNGVDATAVAALSADSPIAWYVTKVGTRILAARIKVGATIFPYDLKWCADGVITDWTNATNGAGGVTLGPEGSDKSSNIIMGLSTLVGAGVIYRQRSIVQAIQTGIGDAPFRFVTVDFGHGTYSPYSIASGGMLGGDYFLGEDYMVYNFDGINSPKPIGEPILDILGSSIYDPAYVISAIDSRRQELWMAFPTTSDLLIKYAYIFSIREWLKSGKLVWRYRSLGAGYRCLDFSQVPQGSDPTVNSATWVVNTDNTIVDQYAVVPGDERLLLGDSAGQAIYMDLSIPVTTGVWQSKTLGDTQREYSLDRVRIKASAMSQSTVEVSVSTDGTNFLYPKTYTIPATGKGEIDVSDFFGLMVTNFQFQLRILSGTPTVSQIAFTLQDHGIAT